MNSRLRRDPVTHPVRLTAVALLLLLPLSACGDDGEANPDGGGGADTGADGDAASGDALPDAAAATWAPTLYRVQNLLIDEPAGLGPLIQSLVQRDINSGLLNILIQTGGFAATSGATTFEIRGGAGESSDGTTFRLINDVDWVPASVEASGDFQNTELLTLDFPVILSLPPRCDGAACPDNRCRDNDDCVGQYTCDSAGDGQCLQHIVLPLKEIRVTGAFTTNDAGTAVLSLASLNGAILKADADQLEVGLPGAEPTLLSTLLGERNMDYPDRTNPTGWRLSALINAVAVVRAAD
jgi:hypothetical protein